MITINLYGLLDNKRIQSDSVPVFNNVNDLIDAIKHAVENKREKIETEEMVTISFGFYIKTIEKDEDRVRLFATIPLVIEKRYRDYLRNNKNHFVINSYLVLVTGKCMKITSFEKIFQNLSAIEDMGINQLKQNEEDKTETLIQFRDKMVEMKSKAQTTKDLLIASTGLAYVYQLIDEYIENHRMELQSKMISDIKSIREEQEKDAEVSNEMEMVIRQIEHVLKTEEERNNDKFLQCIYNGEEISQQEMITTLTNHVLYQDDLEENEIFIGDTLEDEYRIETDKLIITRESGGKLRVSVK